MAGPPKEKPIKALKNSARPIHAYEVPADEGLLSLVETGDTDALATLYDRHARVAYGT